MILIVDDDIAIRTSLDLLLSKEGFDTKQAANANECIDIIRMHRPQLILMDMNFSRDTSGTEGLELLQKVRIFNKEVPIILITGWGTIELAVEGIKLGASDFFTKPWDNQKLLKGIRTHIDLSKNNEKEDFNKRSELDEKYDFSNIIGQHDSLIEVLNNVGKIASTNATVLINGESGTGKELIAEAIHKNSKRSNQAFVKVNLGGISTSLFESEMFGHKKGAFTDAHSDRIGRFEMANGGTIFLDEIGELDLSSQVKLLRVLQEQSYEVLGDSKTKQLDVRVVCATNKNLALLVKEGKFREDLYYRINLINISLPALRERYTDIPLLAKHFSNSVCIANDIESKEFDSSAIDKLKSEAFPGNIRELKNTIERSVFMCSSNTLKGADLQFDNNRNHIESRPVTGISFDDMEKHMIEENMQTYRGNISQVARVLGISRAALYRRFEKYKLSYES